MRPHPVAPHEFAPVFDWSPPRNRNISLISFIAGSTVLHALCFYIFQIVYPPTVALLPPPARVNMITSATEEGRLLLRWIEAEDPALSSTTQLPPDAPSVELPKPVHVPSYKNRQPALRELPPYVPDLSVPSPQPPASVPLLRSPPAAQPAIVATTLTFDDDLGGIELPRLQFTTSSTELPAAARFRLAIDARGVVRHCFVESSSGDVQLDTQARSYILRTRFPAMPNRPSKNEDRFLWTTATVEWGNDISSPAAPAATAPKP